VFAILCFLNGARPVGRALFRWFSGWLKLIWCFLVYLFGSVMGFILVYICWNEIACIGGRFVCG
jgi:glycerol uptake facilitator-like aquaporin